MRIRQGFTLIELAVVLVIVSLLIGGMLVSKQLIRSFQLRKVVSEAREYSVAFNSFKDKYGYWPGDLPNAATLFPATVSIGDGDGYIAGGTGVPYEYITAWQELSAAGLTSYYPSPTGSYDLCSSDNHGRSSVKETLWLIRSDVDDMTPDGGNRIGWHTKSLASFCADKTGNTLTAKEMQAMDTKIDDGMPGHGKVRGQQSSVARATDYCWDNSAAKLETYADNLSTGFACYPEFMLDR